MQQKQTPFLPPFLVSKDEARRLAGGISLRTLEYLIRRGEIQAIRIGRRTLVSRESLENFSRRGVSGGIRLVSAVAKEAN